MADEQTTQPRLLTNRKGQQLETPYSDREAFVELERRVAVGEVTGDFPRDLLHKGRKWGLSDAQFWWVHKLALQQSVEVQCPEIIRRMTMAMAAGVKTRDLKVAVERAEGIVVLAYAGTRSKHRGSVWVTDDGDYPDNTLYGRIDRDSGTFIGRDTPSWIAAVLEDINANPETYLPW